MKKSIKLLSLMLLSCGVLASCANSATKTSTSGKNPVETSETAKPSTSVEDGEAYKATFTTDSHVKVYVYDSSDYTVEPTLATEAYSKDGTSGALTTNGGQINFLLVFDDGYELDSITATDGTYSNIKTPTDTKKENVYRITKITGDLSVNITTKESTGEKITSYKGTFTTDSHVKVYVYNTSDYTTTPILATEALSRDSSTGDETTAGGQINFLLVFDEGYTLDSITATEGTYSNIKSPIDTGVANVYRITKISSDLEITITSKVKTEEDSKDGTIKTSLNGTEYTATCLIENGSYDFDSSTNTLTITCDTSLATAISLSGEMAGNIIIAGEATSQASISLNNFKLISSNLSPIYVSEIDACEIGVSSGTVNTITDNGDARDDDKGAIECACDLKIKGSGSLEIYSKNNNGIHSSDDLKIQNVSLNVNSCDNALKGGDGVTISSGTLELIARCGDGIKTSNTSLSSKGKQKGTISITGGKITIYSATDGIDAACNVEISGTPEIYIYTDKYSSYSEEVTATSESTMYVAYTSTSYKYSLYFVNSSTNEGVWVNTTTYTTVSSGGFGPGGSSSTYYYGVTKPSGYDKVIVYAYSSSQTQGQSTSYTYKSDTMTISSSYDTIKMSYRSGSASWGWTNKQTQSSGGFGPGGGGMQDGNSDKGDYSTKGIKSANSILISGGTINIKSYDDAIHTNAYDDAGTQTTLESGTLSTGYIEISGGDLTLYSNDDGIHADIAFNITGGNITVTNSYEGLEGLYGVISGGNTSITSTDDGVNVTTSTLSTTYPYALQLLGGYLYVNAGGDGLDTNYGASAGGGFGGGSSSSSTSYLGILFDGIDAVVFSSGGGDVCIDTETGYTYKSGRVLSATNSSSGFWNNEAMNCSNFSTIGKAVSTATSTTANTWITCSIDGVMTAAVKMPKAFSIKYLYLGSSSATLTTTTSFDTSTYKVNSDNVYFK